MVLRLSKRPPREQERGSSKKSAPKKSPSPPRRVSPIRLPLQPVPTVPNGTVVMVEVTSAAPDYRKPWKVKREKKSVGTSFVLEVGGRQLLITNSHVIQDQVKVLVKRSDRPALYRANVVYENACCDLALLSVEDDQFWDGLQSLRLIEGNPQIRSQVCIAGYAAEGNSICFTRGIISTMEMYKYYPEYMELLVYHTDATIFSGDSGGPALDDNGNCIGVAFQSTTKSPNLAKVIPSMVVKHFIRDFLRNDNNGFVELGFRYEELHSSVYRALLGMKSSEDGLGVLVSEDHLNTGVLKESDVILYFDNYAIGSDGMIEIYEGHRIPFTYCLINKYRNDVVKLYIIRDKHRRYVDLKLEGFERLVPPYIRKTRPSYFILAGIVFVASTLTYVRTLGSSSNIVRHTPPGPKQYQEIRISCVFHNQLTSVFKIDEGCIVSSFNGEAIYGLQELIDKIINPGTHFLQFVLNPRKHLYLDKNQAMQETCTFLDQEKIPPCSLDLFRWTFPARNTNLP